MNKKIVAVGIVVLVLGIIIAAVGFTGMLNKRMADLEADYDNDTHSFRSYKEGDVITVTGKITNESELSASEKILLNSNYQYELDGVDSFVSDEDIGNVGDTITVNLEVKTLDLGILGSADYLEAKSVEKTPVLGVLGILLLIVGVILAIVGAIMKTKTYPNPSVLPNQSYQQYPEQPYNQYAQSQQPVAQYPPPETPQNPENEQHF